MEFTKFCHFLSHPLVVLATLLIWVLTCLGIVTSPKAVAQEWLFSPPPISKRQVTLDTIKPSDALSRVRVLSDLLEGIRQEMGKPKDLPRTRLAMNAHPHEVYFQALTLYLKSDRLALELTGSTGLQPIPVSPEEIRPYHTWLVVNAAFHRLLVIKDKLHIPENFPEQSSPNTTTPTDVGRAIVQANRQLNLMLEHRVSPSEVFQQVEAARRLAQHLLQGFPKAKTTYPLPPFQRKKTPNDVFLQLIRCFERLEEFAKASGVSILHLDGTAARTVTADYQIQPGNVYDLATLILAELPFTNTWEFNPLALEKFERG